VLRDKVRLAFSYFRKSLYQRLRHRAYGSRTTAVRLG
jgi:hypothetical protein